MNRSGKNEWDIYLFHRGRHRRIYEYMGANLEEKEWVIRTWAPNAKSIQLIGDFNDWNGKDHFMSRINNEGIWEIKAQNLKKGERYKFRVESQNGEMQDKADPYAFYSQIRPETASVLYGHRFQYEWKDEEWMKERKSFYEKPINIYEIHLGSWKRKENKTFLNYREIADELAIYLKEMSYTHVEIMPINEHPLDDSWGYQPTGYYSVTSRYGTPEDFMYFIDKMHKEEIGVILDWVPSHFCKDTHGLYRFDGTPTYEYSSKILAENHDWGTLNFDLGRNEINSFLISNALFWLREFHIDGLRLDAVANMLYLDYGKQDHPELKNIYGKNENLDAVKFLKELNKAINEEFPSALICAEESTAWPEVTGNPAQKSLGFDCKWNMGWMNDILEYMKLDPLWRDNNHEKMTFSFMYAFAENYILPFSHDEVVHGKCSLINKMPGEMWDKFANLRALMGFMMAHPGKKLNFMGNEFAQYLEWRFYEELEWNVLELDNNKKFHTYIKDLNRFYKEEKALWEMDFNPRGVQWMNHYDREGNVVVFTRRSCDIDDFITVVVNFSGEYRENYRVPVPMDGIYKEVFTSNNLKYGGSGLLNIDNIIPLNGAINIELPSFSALFFKKEF